MAGEQDLSQDLEAACPKLPFVNFLVVICFKGKHLKLRLQPLTCISIMKSSKMFMYNLPWELY